MKNAPAVGLRWTGRIPALSAGFILRRKKMNRIFLYCAAMLGWFAVGVCELMKDRVSKASYCILWLSYLSSLLTVFLGGLYG